MSCRRSRPLKPWTKNLHALRIHLHLPPQFLQSVIDSSVQCRSLVHSREVFRAAIRDAAKSIILVHNHPSGDPTPSREDLLVTKKLEDAGLTLGIQVLDHVIVSRNGEVSVRTFLETRGTP